MGKIVFAAEKLFTNRLILRKLERSDFPILSEWSNSKDAYGNYLSPERMAKSDIEQRYASGLFWNSTEKLFLIEKKNRAAIGTINYWLPADKLQTAIVAVKIAEPAERNKGYGTEAQKSLIIFLFDKVKVAHVDMYADVDNIAQQRCLGKLGFQLKETLTYDDGGTRRTGNLYRITSAQFRKQPIFKFHYE